MKGNILTTREGTTRYIKLTGRVTFSASSRFDTFIEQQADADVTDVVIDLNETEYVDSTILGLLAKVARHLIARRHCKPTILCGVEDINAVLDSMGFDAAFVIEHRTDEAGHTYEELPAVESGDAPQSGTLLQAHETLAELNDQNRETFQGTIDALKQEP